MITVNVTNPSGQEVSLRLPSDGELLEVLRGRVRRDDLLSVEVVEQSDDVDDLHDLRAQAAAAGVKVDQRWKADRLRKEIAAKKTADEE